MVNNRRRLIGRVVSDKMDKTIVVEIERRKMHRVYKKVVRTTKKILAHDENNEVPVGALVRVVESQPLSKRKRWALEEILERPEDLVAARDAAERKPEPAPDQEITAEVEVEVEEEA